MSEQPTSPRTIEIKVPTSPILVAGVGIAIAALVAVIIGLAVGTSSHVGPVNPTTFVIAKCGSAFSSHSGYGCHRVLHHATVMSGWLLYGGIVVFVLAVVGLIIPGAVARSNRQKEIIQDAIASRQSALP